MQGGKNQEKESAIQRKAELTNRLQYRVKWFFTQLSKKRVSTLDYCIQVPLIKAWQVNKEIQMHNYSLKRLPNRYHFHTEIMGNVNLFHWAFIWIHVTQMPLFDFKFNNHYVYFVYLLNNSVWVSVMRETVNLCGGSAHTHTVTHTKGATNEPQAKCLILRAKGIFHTCTNIVLGGCSS